MTCFRRSQTALRSSEPGCLGTLIQILKTSPAADIVDQQGSEIDLLCLDIGRQFGAPVLSRGAGTSLAGQCCNVAAVLDFSKYMNRVLALNAKERYAIVEPGVVLDALRNKAVAVGLTFVPDPATHTHCTLGGMIGNNSCGSHALMGGKADDNTLELEVLLYDGTIMTVGATSEAELVRRAVGGGRPAEILRGVLRLREQYAELVRKRFPSIPRRVSGYNLDRLLPEAGCNIAQSLVGSEVRASLSLRRSCVWLPIPHIARLWCAGSLTFLSRVIIFRRSSHISRLQSKGSTAS